MIHDLTINLPQGNLQVKYYSDSGGILLKSIYIEWISQHIDVGGDLWEDLTKDNPVKDMLIITSHGDQGGDFGEYLDKSLYSIVLLNIIKDYYKDNISEFNNLKYIYLRICYSASNYDIEGTFLKNKNYTSDLIGSLSDYLASSTKKIIIGSTGSLTIEEIKIIKPEIPINIEQKNVFCNAGLVVSYINQNNELIANFYKNSDSLLIDNKELTDKLLNFHLAPKDNHFNYRTQYTNKEIVDLYLIALFSTMISVYLRLLRNKEIIRPLFIHLAILHFIAISSRIFSKYITKGIYKLQIRGAEDFFSDKIINYSVLKNKKEGVKLEEPEANNIALLEVNKFRNLKAKSDIDNNHKFKFNNNVRKRNLIRSISL